MEQAMELNKETALRLWAAQFGKTAKAKDFAGREIAKAAYNDRNSQYGWNVDHILPQARGGKTADHNLICCHIQTNDEKANRFPCFTANGIQFEIQKRQNHYEILKKAVPAAENDEATGVNFWDAAQGMKVWRKSKNWKGEEFLGYAQIRVDSKQPNDSFFQRFYIFLGDIFDGWTVTVKRNWNTWGFGCIFQVLGKKLPTIEDTEDFLDQCILLNTYCSLFREKYNLNIDICCGMKYCQFSADAWERTMNDILNSTPQYNGPLSIDELIRINTSAKKRIPESVGSGFAPYDLVFTKLDKNLKKYL